MPKNIKGREIAEIIPDKCIACQLCIGECPINAIDMQGGAVRIDPEACAGCGRCLDVCPANAILFEKPVRKKMTGIGQKPHPLEGYRGIAVFIEAHDGTGAEVSWELVGKARELAEKLETQVLGFLPGTDVEPVAREAIAYGCDTVYMVDNPLLQKYLSRMYGRALAHMCNQVKPEILLVGATSLGRDLASVVATQLETGLTADCTGLDINPQERLLLMTRPTFGGNIMATILCRNHRPQMSTVRPKVMKLPKKDTGRRGEIRTFDLETSQEVVQVPRIIDFIPRAAEVGGVDITRAEVLVVIGKGACDPRHLPMFEELAMLMGGTVACSRPVVQSGLLPHIRQVGQTGKTVAPKVYIGVAVSGAVQHLVGMQGAEKIVAINIARQAPLVQIADYALIGDYREIIPKLIKGIESRIKVIR
ncbi:MAG: electron transfer flavoprotein alpha subunit apoprotein [Dehalococcoidia bacterium]|nr:electron transfer flavoprotein alpha subunit apoprotein [Dehalococcoidia bacterium]